MGGAAQRAETLLGGINMRLLLVEDDQSLGEAVTQHLRARRFDTVWATSLAAARAAIEAQLPDLMLLDLRLPDGSGLDLLRSLARAPDAQRAHLPVIVLTARDQLRDRIAGLDAGADDYLVKPFDLAELTARIHAVARRSLGPNRLRVGELEIDRAQRRLWRNDHELVMTAREWAILDELARRPGTLVNRETLEQRLAEHGADIESNALEVYVSRMRKKLGAPVIETLRGIGYRLRT